MSLKDDIPMIIDFYKKHIDTIQMNCNLIDIYDGNLLQYVLSDLKKQLSEDTYNACSHRVAPINLLTKIVQKTASIYNPSPMRRVADGVPADEELFNWYQEKLNPNKFFMQAAKLLSMCKSCLIQPYVHNMMPQMRVIQNDKFFVISTDKIDDMTPTHVVTFEYRKNDFAVEKPVFYAYTADEFLIFDVDKNIYLQEMAELDNIEGNNRYGVLPFTYETGSESKLYPKPDSDIFTMTKLLPVMLTDLNYAVMYQCFSIYYGINVDDEDMKMAPNVFWRLKKDPTRDGNPELGVIKGTVDYDGVMSTIQTQISLWLNSKGIRPGAIGKLDGDNFANGISKMIDEMDTHEAKEMLSAAFIKIEEQFWDLILHKLHPYWVANDLVEMRELFSESAYIETVFNVQQPLQSRGQLVTDLKAEVDAGFTSRQRAIQNLNPLMDEVEVEELMAEIAAGSANSSTATIEVQPGAQDDSNNT